MNPLLFSLARLALFLQTPLEPEVKNGRAEIEQFQH
jgi:hypothetical protein